MYKLIIEDDEGKTTVVPLIRDEITVGRKEGSTIRLTERNVSRRHAKICKTDGVVEIENVASRYGTKLNGVKIDGRTPFREGDVLLIGDYRLSLQSDRKGKVETPDTGLKRKSDAAPAASTAPAAELSPEQSAHLVVISSNFAGREYALTGTEMIIGRTEGHIRLDHRSISRNHAKIVREGSEYKVLDLNSSNGVKVNGDEYRSVQLKRGDVIELGHVRFRFVEPGENFVFQPEPAAAMEAPPVASSNAVKVLAAGVVGIVIVGILVVIALIVIGSKVTEQKGTGDDVPVVKHVPTEPDNPPKTYDKERIDKLLANADELAADRQWKSAKGIYKMVLEDDPANARARDGLSKANTEEPFKAAYDDGKKALESDRFQEAISKFRSVSSVSDYAALIKNEKLIEKAEKGMLEVTLKEAKALVRKREWQDARAKVAAVLEIDPDNQEAKELRKKINKKSGAPTNGKKPNGVSNPAERPGDSSNKPPADTGPKMSKEERRAKVKQLLKEARQASMRGSQQQAIALAKEALPLGGGAQANRILAIAYEKIGDKAKAVQYYNKWLKTNCDSRIAPTVRKKIVAAGGSPAC